MADGVIQVNPDSTGKKLDTEELARAADGVVVERERVVLQRPGDPSSSMRPEFSSPTLLGAVRSAVAQLGEIRKTLRQRGAESADIRRFNPKRAGQSLLRMTGVESLAVAQVEPPYTEATRAGRRFCWSYPAGAEAVTARSSFPASSCDLILWNSAPPGGPTIFLDLAAVYFNGGSTATAAVLGIVPSPLPIAGSVTLPSNFSTANPMSTSGSSRGAVGQILVATGMTMPSRPDGSKTTFYPIAGGPHAGAAASPEGFGFGDVGGRFAAPPGHGLCFVVQSSSANTYGISLAWVELALDME